MLDNVGLFIFCGSGIFGYVQKNLVYMCFWDCIVFYLKDFDSMCYKQCQLDKGIFDYECKREVEVKVFDLCDKFEEEEYVFNM